MTEGPLSQQERAALRDRVARLAHRPALAVVCLGELPAWVGEDCAACGLYCERYALPPGMGEAGLAELLAALSRRHGLEGEMLWPAAVGGLGGLASVPPEKNMAAPTWAQVLEQTLERAEMIDKNQG